MNNPLLQMSGLPPFPEILPEHVEPAVDQVLAENREAMNALLDQSEPFTWDNFIHPLALLEDRLNRIWSPVRHMNSVVNSESLRQAYNACLPKLSDYATEMGQNVRLFQAYQSMAEGPGFADLSPTQQRVITNALRDFHLSGVDLRDEQKDRYKEIAQGLSQLTSRFEENVLDATQAWQRHVPEEASLKGLPESAMDMLRQNARQRSLEGCLITLEFPSYYAIMTFADDRELRREVYGAYVTRASDEGPHDRKFDNSEVMERILALRNEQARLLGYDNYAQLSLATKMAESPEQVVGFLTDLAERARPAAVQELETLNEFAREHLELEDLQAWDLAYASEKLRQHAYNLSQEDLKPYFPVDRVLQGLFDLVERLYQVRIHQETGVPVWHEEVRFYEIQDPDGTPRARFYLDLYARSHKRGGAWMDECLNRLRDGDDLQLPVAYMTCNSTPPVGGKPALFTHDEVLTLFHEFGHGLHHMLTRVDCPDVAGINGVEWDAVELPSQFMENWCWEREALDMFAAHHETGEPLPQDLFDKLLATRHFQAAMQMVRQLEFSLFDMRLHAEYDPDRGARIQEILDQVRDQVAVMKPPAFNRFQHGFSHIFAGGYAAGYYSYKWAEVLSADAFARFEEEGLFSPGVGHAFLTEILEQGGSRPALEHFKAFRGREPDIEALLRHSGLAAA
ncbi:MULTISPECIES: oligopeptidase A [unclassified Ectothiorhodospira]|uniref:oligopeptidase A n=1 Tax=unclassified Ectothiorhodospira TaxID=2684909 RepID=UPI001EE9A82D|nr:MULTISPECIES: oligopeptidase A [unclassified Ectothiorhodospira]MCG5515462.1 oligopeptidase A [Ectothiorhodospira sp. 9100]MCG5518165.1 oligopeptidase A [Ectothiorhodospira sp. 9905]